MAIQKNKAIIRITKSLTKKGKIKGRNKKETRAMKAACVHHKLNKHGKVKPMIFSNDGEYVICTACQKRFPASFFTKEEVKEKVNDFEEMNNHFKYLVTAGNMGEKACDYFVNTAVILGEYPKMAKRATKFAEKQSKAKKKKKPSMTGSSYYGSWGSKK